MMCNAGFSPLKILHCTVCTMHCCECRAAYGQGSAMFWYRFSNSVLSIAPRVLLQQRFKSRFFRMSPSTSRELPFVSQQKMTAEPSPAPFPSSNQYCSAFPLLFELLLYSRCNSGVLCSIYIYIYVLLFFYVRSLYEPYVHIRMDNMGIVCLLVCCQKT
jgi:hypothetical protein